MPKHWVLISFVALIIIVSGFVYWNRERPVQNISTFEECAGAGNPVMESYPAQCRTKEGRAFVQNIGNELEKSDLIRIDSPRPNQVVSHEIKITGEARGPWFFEASFPIRLENREGQVLASAIATAQGEWMTESFVPFAANLSVPADFHGEATLILEKDNPSDLPEHADALLVPVKVE